MQLEAACSAIAARIWGWAASSHISPELVCSWVAECMVIPALRRKGPARIVQQFIGSQSAPLQISARTCCFEGAPAPALSWHQHVQRPGDGTLTLAVRQFISYQPWKDVAAEGDSRKLHSCSSCWHAGAPCPLPLHEGEQHLATPADRSPQGAALPRHLQSIIAKLPVVGAGAVNAACCTA